MQENHPSRWPKGLAWVLVGLFALLILYNIYQGLTVQKIGVFGLNVEFGDKATGQGLGGVGQAENVTTEEQVARQAALEARVQDLQQRLENAEQSSQPNEALAQQAPPAPANPAGANEGPDALFENLVESGQVDLGATATDITGTWTTSEGLVYEIEQRGNFVTMLEFNPLFGLSAVFDGTITGDSISGSFEATTGVTGTGSMTIAPGGDRIDARFAEPFFGTSTSVIMFRQ